MENTDNKYAPVVSVLGHVDHGKTTLLDALRKSTIASREHGGITQNIGTSEVETIHEGKTRKITFIDTPGHAAFENMRSQGVSAADIVLLIVAADDGIMPQTRESIAKILEAKIPFIVVFTKIDMPGAQIEKVKQQILGEGILLEGLGGEVPFIGVSAKTGEHIQDLLDLILLAYDLSGIKKDENSDFMGVVIDAEADKRRGIVATAIVKQGHIDVGKQIYVHGKVVGKARALVDSKGKNVKVAIPGMGIEILGASEMLPAGSVIFDREVEPAIKENTLPTVEEKFDLASFLGGTNRDIIPIVLKTSTSAEMEAVKGSLPEKVKAILS